MRVQRLLRPVHGQQLAKPRVAIFVIDEFEACRRLHVRHVKVGQVRDACERRADLVVLGAVGVDQLEPRGVLLAVSGLNPPVGSHRALTHGRAYHQAPLVAQDW